MTQPDNTNTTPSDAKDEVVERVAQAIYEKIPMSKREFNPDLYRGMAHAAIQAMTPRNSLGEEDAVRILYKSYKQNLQRLKSSGAMREAYRSLLTAIQNSEADNG